MVIVGSQCFSVVLVVFIGFQRFFIVVMGSQWFS